MAEYAGPVRSAYFRDDATLVEVFCGAGEYRYEITSPDGLTIASGDGYTDEQAAIDAAMEHDA